MCLTTKAIEERKWGELHHLREIFSDRRIPERFFKPTSASYTPLDHEHYFQKIVSVIWEDDGKFLEDVQPENIEAFICELDRLAEGAGYFANFHRGEAERLEKFGKFVRKLENEAYGQRRAQHQSSKKD